MDGSLEGSRSARLISVDAPIFAPNDTDPLYLTLTNPYASSPNEFEREALQVMSSRTPTRIMLSVWKALLLREATFRLFGSRGAWFWLIAEPLAHFAFLTFLFAVIRHNSVGGINVSIWLILGLFGYFTFRRTAAQMGGAIDSNRALFTYRQVLPFDTILVRGFLEGLIMLVALIMVIFGMSLLGIPVTPEHPVKIIMALFGLWLMGAALGLIVTMLAEIAGEIRQLLNMMMMPLYFVSGVLLPISAVPPQQQSYFLINPLIHGLESARSGFSSFYHTSPDISLAYLYLWALCGLGIGMLLYRRFAKTISAI